MDNGIPRKCDAVDKSGLSWSTILVEPGLRAAPYHELIIPKHAVARLDELTLDEEAACWSFAFERANHALNEGGMDGVAFLIQDGAPAAQTVGHVHIHVVGFMGPMAHMNIVEEMDKLSLKFCHESRRPIKEGTIHTSENFVSTLRNLRRMLADSHNEFGYNIYSTTPIREISPIVPVAFKVECWSPDSPREYGLANFLRVLNGYRDKPYDWPRENLGRVFEAKPE